MVYGEVVVSSYFIWRHMTFVPSLCHLHMLPVHA